MDFIRRNFGLKVAAVLIAIGLWFTFNYLTLSQAYSTTLQVPLIVHGVNPGLIATSAVHDITVELNGPRSALESLAPSDFAAFVDASGKDAGAFSLNVTVAGPATDKIRSVSPSSAIVVLDRYGYRMVPVISSDVGPTASVSSIDPRSVSVSGPESELAKVMAARANLEAASTTKPVTIVVRPVAVDADFAPITGVSVVPPTVRVAIVPRRAAY